MVTTYADAAIPGEVLVSARLRWGVSASEAELRLRAVLQMQERLLAMRDQGVDVAGWVVDGADDVTRRLWHAVEVLVGRALVSCRENQAESLAVWFCPVAEEDVRRLPAGWWDTPLGVLCARVLRGAGRIG